MASEQARRENERLIEVEKDRVPKMTTHFESLAEKTRDEHPHDPHLRPHHHVQTVKEEDQTGGSAKKRADHDEHEPQMHPPATAEKQHDRAGGQPETKGPSLEEISNLRATAQQKSAEAIRAAEERYHKAKGETQGAGAQDLEEDVSSTKGGGTLKDTAVEKSQQAKDVILTKGVAMKDTAVEKSQQAKDIMAQKAPEVKDVLMSKGQTATQYAAEKAKAAKQTTVDASTGAAEYVGEKAVAAKDVTVEGGKGAAEYAGKVASGLKDQAVVTGWGATHYTMEKVAEATKAAAGLTSSVAGYTTDKVAGAGKNIAGYAGEKLAAAMDTVVATEEKTADYAARKKAEAQKDMEEKKLSHEQQVSNLSSEAKKDLEEKKLSHVEGPGESLGSKAQHKAGEQLQETPTFEETKEYFQGPEEGEQKKQQEGSEPRQGGSGTGSVFQAIGETIVEIGQTTKDLLVGQHPVQVAEEENKEPYTGTGRGI